MAAEALEAAAARAGVDVVVETQGSAGSTPLPRETIAGGRRRDLRRRRRACATAAGSPASRSSSSGVKRPIDDADAMIAEARALRRRPERPARRGRAAVPPRRQAARAAVSETWGGRTRRVLMTGVSYMIPFVAAGGLLIALGFLFGGYEIVDVYGNDRASTTRCSTCRTRRRWDCTTRCSNSGLLRLPRRAVLHHRQDRLQLLRARRWPATSPTRSPTGRASPPASSWVAWPSTCSGDRPGRHQPGQLPATGFLGGIVGGVLAGVVAHWITGWKVPAWARGLMPVLVIPLLTTHHLPAGHDHRARQAASAT